MNARCALIVTDRKTYSDAKRFCSAQNVTYFQMTMNAQLRDLSGWSYDSHLKCKCPLMMMIQLVNFKENILVIFLS